MRAPSSPTLLPRLALVVAGLAIGAVLVTVAGGLVGFVWPGSPPQEEPSEIVLAGSRAQPARDRQPPADVRARRVARPAPGRVAPAASEVDVARPAAPTAGLLAGDEQPVFPEPEPPLPPDPPPPPAEDPIGPLEPVADALVGTTSVLAHGMRRVTNALAEGVAPALPAVAPAVTRIGEVLAATLDATGRALDELLGGGPVR